MNDREREQNLIAQINLWGPRILIGLSILLLVYFTQRTYRFSGLFDETFLAEENLTLTRGPFAPKAYYERGEVDYQSKPLFEEEGDEIDTSLFEFTEEAPSPDEEASPDQ
jgi:hypothetical protein